MKGFLAFTFATATVCALTLLDPSLARWLVSSAFWIGLGVLGCAYVASALPRRTGRRR